MMDLPQHYFPTQFCPHSENKTHPRILFSDYGSPGNVDVNYNDDSGGNHSLEYIVQKGQGVIEGLEKCLPPLPLFDQPLQDDTSLRDQILGFPHWGDTIKAFKRLCLQKGGIRRKLKMERNDFYVSIQCFQACKEIVQDCFAKYEANHDQATEAPVDENERKKFQDHVQVWMEKAQADYKLIAKANTNDCFSGFNREFYGGLVNHSIDSLSSPEYLFHASGENFSEIWMTAVAEGEKSCFQSPVTKAKVKMAYPAYQICNAQRISGRGIICARHKNCCSLLTCDTFNDPSLTLQDTIASTNGILTSMALSPYMEDEILVTHQGGNVKLWNIKSRCPQTVCAGKEPEASQRWACSYFAGHPRQIAMARLNSVRIFDHRNGFADGVTLFSMKDNLTTSKEQVQAAAFAGFPHHVVVTDYSICVMDQRLPTKPVYQWYPDFRGIPQYLQVFQHVDGHSEAGRQDADVYIFAATQQPAEIMCFPVSFSVGQPTHSKILPWKAGDSGAWLDAGSTVDYDTAEAVDKRLEASLAGFTVVKNASAHSLSLTVIQMDSYGDLFYQRCQFQDDGLNLQGPEECDRDAAKEKIGSWLSSFSEHHKKLLPSSSKELPSSSQSYKIADAQVCLIKNKRLKREQKPIMPEEVVRRSKLRRMKNLPKSNSNTALLLALRDGAPDITNLIEKRENYHRKERIKLQRETMMRIRAENLDRLFENFVSSPYCKPRSGNTSPKSTSSSSSSDSDENSSES